jgi:hypothetical protein
LLLPFLSRLKTRTVTETYFENSDRYWYRDEYDENGKETYYETSKGYWERFEYDENGKETYCENSAWGQGRNQAVAPVMVRSLKLMVRSTS